MTAASTGPFSAFLSFMVDSGVREGKTWWVSLVAKNRVVLGVWEMAGWSCLSSQGALLWLKGSGVREGGLGGCPEETQPPRRWRAAAFSEGGDPWACFPVPFEVGDGNQR